MPDVSKEGKNDDWGPSCHWTTQSRWSDTHLVRSAEADGVKVGKDVQLGQVYAGQPVDPTAIPLVRSVARIEGGKFCQI